MKKLLLGFVLAPSASMSAAQALDEECIDLDDTWFCLDPFVEPGATFEDAVIGVYRPGEDNAWIAILNPNNPRTLPPSPIFPSDPIQPIILTRPGQ